jgi:Icc-related predicted phosphoesterase
MINVTALILTFLGLTTLAVSARPHHEENHGFESFSFIHMGDPQIGFGLDGPANDTFRFKLAADEAKYKWKVPFVVIAGDLTNDRTQLEVDGYYEGERQFAKNDIDKYAVPGNHDVSSMATLESFRKNYSQPDYYTFERNKSRFFMLNSITLISNLTELAATHDEQWAWFERELELASHEKNNGPTFVVFHHPPFLVTEDEPDQYFNWPSAPRKRFLALIRKYNIHHLLVGHRHETFTATPTDNAFTIYIVAGTALYFDNNGFGYRVFNVSSPDPVNGVSQQYVHLDLGGQVVTHLQGQGLPNGCPNIFEH